MAVVPAIEFDEHVPARGRSCQAECGHCRLGTRGDEPHEVDTRKGLFDELGKFELGFGGGTEARTSVSRVMNCGDDAGVCVARDEWAPRGQVVDVTIAVDVPDRRALAAGNEQ